MLYEFNGSAGSATDLEGDDVDVSSAGDVELESLRKHAQRIIDIHDWEWTDVEEGVEQASRAVKLFEDSIRSVGKGVEISVEKENDAATREKRFGAQVEKREAGLSPPADGREQPTASRGRWGFLRFIRKTLHRRPGGHNEGEALFASSLRA